MCCVCFIFYFKVFSTFYFQFRYKIVIVFFILMRKYEIKIELEDSIISGEKHENRGMDEKACENEICEDAVAVIGEIIIWIAFQQGKNFKTNT